VVEKPFTVSTEETRGMTTDDDDDEVDGIKLGL